MTLGSARDQFDQITGSLGSAVGSHYSLLDMLPLDLPFIHSNLFAPRWRQISELVVLIAEVEWAFAVLDAATVSSARDPATIQKCFRSTVVAQSSTPTHMLGLLTNMPEVGLFLCIDTIDVRSAAFAAYSASGAATKTSTNGGHGEGQVYGPIAKV